MAKRKTQALSLLEGILDETAAEAEVAREALEAELSRKRAAAELQAIETERKRGEEIARLMREGEERQDAAAARRAAAVAAMRTEELQTDGLQPASESVAAEGNLNSRPVSSSSVVAFDRSHGHGGWFAAAAAVLFVSVAAGGAYLHKTQRFVDSTTAFLTVAPEVVTLASARSTVEFRAILEPEIVIAEPIAGRSRRDEPRPRPTTEVRGEPRSAPRSLPVDLRNLRPD